MGERGPVPKRSDQRRRTNAPETPIIKAPAGASTPAPRQADTAWHAVATIWYESLELSGQSAFYEPTDWAIAYLLAESMSRDLSPQFVAVTEQGDSVYETIPLKGASLGAYLKAFGSLLLTEGDRRRMAVELEKPKAVDPDEAAAAATVTDIFSRLGSA